MSQQKNINQVLEEITAVTKEMQQVAQSFAAFKNNLTAETQQLQAIVVDSKAQAEEALKNTKGIEEILTEKLRGCAAIMNQATELAKVNGVSKEIECLLQLCGMFMDVSEITKTLLGKHEALIEEKYQLHNSKVLLNGEYLKLQLTTEHKAVEDKTTELDSRFAALQKEADDLTNDTTQP